MNHEASNTPSVSNTESSQLLLKLRRRLKNLNTMLQGVQEKARQSNDQTAQELILRAQANAGTVTAFTEATQAVIANDESLQVNGLELNISTISLQDIAELEQLRLSLSGGPGCRSANSAGKIAPLESLDNLTLGLPEPCQGEGCISAGPGFAQALENINNMTGVGTAPSALAAGNAVAEEICIAVPVTAETHDFYLQEFLKLTELALARAELQLKQARQAACSASGQEMCSLY